MSDQEFEFPVHRNDFCELGKQLSQNNYYRSLMVARASVCIVGIALCLMVLFSKLRTVILHVHARILLKYHLLITLILTCNYLTIAIFELYRLGGDLPPCAYTMPRWLSFTPHFITTTMIHCQILSCMCITIERLICTVRIRTYENTNYGKSLVLGLFLMTITVVLGSYAILGLSANWNIRLFYISFRDISNHYIGSAYVFAQFCGDLITIILCKVVDVLNRRTKRRFVNGLIGMKHRDNQLSSKLQIRENIVLSSVLQPIICVHFAITAFSALVISVVMMSLRHNMLLTVITAESCSLFPLYSSILPVLIFRRHPSLFWNMAERLTRRRLRRIDVPKQKRENAEFENHFKWFDKMLDYNGPVRV